MNLSVLSLMVIAVFCVSIRSQETPSTESKDLKCTFPKVEIVSRQLVNNNGQTVESPVSLTEYTICDEQHRELEDGELLNGEPDIKWVSRYDENGNEIEHAFYTHGELTHRSVSSYDKSGKLISARNEDGSKAVCRNTKTESSCKLVGAGGKLQTHSVTTYDGLGRVVKKVEFQPGRGLVHRYVYGYDLWGNRNLEADYYHSDGKGKNSRSIFTFDKARKLLEKLWYDQTGLRTREVYEYNQRGDLIQRTEYGVDKSVIEKMTVEYQSYDTKGNWTRAVECRIRSQSGKPTLDIRRVLHRTITYVKSPVAFGLP